METTLGCRGAHTNITGFEDGQLRRSHHIRGARVKVKTLPTFDDVLHFILTSDRIGIDAHRCIPTDSIPDVSIHCGITPQYVNISRDGECLGRYSCRYTNFSVRCNTHALCIFCFEPNVLVRTRSARTIYLNGAYIGSSWTGFESEYIGSTVSTISVCMNCDTRCR